MATDLERLVVQLSADVKNYERAMARASGVTNRQFNAIERRAQRMNSRLNAIGANAARGLIAPLSGIGAALGVAEITRYADAWTEAGNKIRAAATSAGVQVRSLDELKDGANDARTDLGAYVDLYARLIRSASGVAKSEQEIADATNIVSKAFKAGGASASEQAAGILQLGQALGSGVLQGDELRSLRENAPILAQAIAKEFETTIAGLKELGAEGELTSERVFKAIINAQKPIEAQFAATNSTIRDAITEINNEFTAYIGNADASAGASARLVEALNILAENFTKVADTVVTFATLLIGALTGRAVAGLVVGLGNAVVALGAFLTALRTGTAVAAGFSAALGPIGLFAGAAATAIYLFADSSSDAEKAAASHAEALSELLYQIENVDYANSEAVLSTRQKIAADIDAAKTAIARAKAERELAASIAAANQASTVPIPGLSPEQQAANAAGAVASDPLVLDREAYIGELERQVGELQNLSTKFEDFASGRAKPTRGTTSTGFGGGSGASADGGGKKGRAPRENDFEREIEAIRKRTELIIAETEAMRGINPLVEDYGFTIEKVRASQDLLNAAKEAGVAVTPELKAQIDQLATGYATASAEADRLAESQDKARQRAEEMRDLGKDVLGGFITDIRNGTSAADALANGLDKIADKLLDIALNSLFEGGGGGGGGGGLSGIFSGIGRILGLKGGGAVRGPGTGTSDSIPARLSNGEFVVNAAATRRHRNLLEAINAGEAAGYANGGAVGAPSMPILTRSAPSGGAGLQVTYAPQIDARGADSAAIARLEQQMAKDRADFPYRVQRAVAEGRATRAIR